MLPLLGLAISFICYVVAAQLYVGGSAHDPSPRGYAHFSNYLCDLFSDPARGQPRMASRPWGIVALGSLSFSLVSLSLLIVRLMRPDSIGARWVPLLGGLGGMSGCLVFTSLHDQAIVFGFVPTALAFLLCLFEINRAGYVRLAWLGLWPLVVGSLNFALWASRCLVPTIPLIQKLAILGLILWIWVTCTTLLWLNRRD